MTLDAHTDRLNHLIYLHNQFAKAIKLVEAVNFELDMASLNDCRYALRAVMDCIESGLNSNNEQFVDAFGRAQNALHIVWHDTVDIAYIQFKLYLNQLSKDYGPDLVAGAIDVTKCKEALYKIEDLITESRGDRKKRIELYTSITCNDLEPILKLYRNAIDAEPAIAAKKRREDGKRRLTILVIVVGILGAIVAL